MQFERCTHVDAAMRSYAAAALLCAAAMVVALLGRGRDATPDTEPETEPLAPDAFSSLFCEGDTPATRHCLVTNLCYMPDDDQFVLLYSERTRYAGVRGADDLRPLLKLSPVVDHNLFDLHLVPANASLLAGRGAVLHRGRFLVFEPFKPDNLMHVLHDDLLPAYVTLLQLRLLEWRAPLNVPAGRSVSYRVWVEQGAAGVSEHKVRQPRLQLAAECANCELRVWLRPELDGRRGPVLHETFVLNGDAT
ncbi:protein O-linked-mannose beta-1,4-N-acetylglucosaminyltransferase 2-like [Pollicipes pollicipes]|uniref:protein O-linked-mannose beta-1,4-N-acetylglucosaminyltransferase 2-like n=1 Tax=Pollicipes pollicipes TaxID=41117 RepID=UPI001885A08E|nr:protein O-linked-mannose beta-1,4-N-acetylglucosaminyltransferase 2-like [Pollicipes pollicipes]